MKLSHRFMIIFSSALLVGITLMALTIYSNFEMTRTKYVDDMYVSIESIIDNYFNREIEELETIIKSYSIDTQLIEALKKQDRVWITRNVANAMYDRDEIDVHSIYVYSPSHDLEMAFGNLSYAQISEISIVRRTLLDQNFHVEFKTFSDHLYVFVSMPIYNDVKKQPTGIVLIGRTLSIGRVTELTENLNVFSFEHMLLNNKPSSEPIERGHGDTIWMHFSIPNNNYVASWLHLKFSLSNILSLFNDSFRSILVIASATLMTTLSIVLWQTVKTSRIIEDNVGQIESIASGEYTDILPERGSMEIIKLSKSVNKLASDLNRQHRMIEQSYFDTIQLLVKTMEVTDYYTKGHSDRVADMARALAYFMNFDKVDQLYTAALMHDIGKVSIPHNILNKPSKLNDDEYKLIQQHPITGHKILEASFVFEEVKEYILHHHEKFDGTGYPYGLMSHNIPLGSRILSIVDVFDALTSDRSYRNALDLHEATELIVKDSGKAFDPIVVQAFVDNIDEIYKFTALYVQENAS